MTDFELCVITPPCNVKEEIDTIIGLFDLGLKKLHVRKPSFSPKALEKYLLKIPTKYFQNIVIHDHYRLAIDHQLLGIHINAKKLHSITPIEEVIGCQIFPLTIDYPKSQLFVHGQPVDHVSYSAHTLNEVRNLPDVFSYIFLSPIYDSISKEQYRSAFSERELESVVEFRKKIYALGGVQSTNIQSLVKWSFRGAAVLGSIWQFDCVFSRLKSFEKLFKTKLCAL